MGQVRVYTVAHSCAGCVDADVTTDDLEAIVEAIEGDARHGACHRIQAILWGKPSLGSKMPCHMIMARASLRQGDHGCHAMAPHCPPRVASVLLAGLGCAALRVSDLRTPKFGVRRRVHSRAEDDPRIPRTPRADRVFSSADLCSLSRTPPGPRSVTVRSRVGSVQSENYLRALKNNYPIPQPHAPPG